MGEIWGAHLARTVLTIAGALAFVVLYVVFGVETWEASGSPPALDSELEKLAIALAGAVGAIFAIGLGVSPPTPDNTVRARLSVGKTFAPRLPKGVSLTATVCFWAYLAVGLFAWITWVANKSVCPTAIKTISELMVGYVVALIGALALGKRTS